MTTAANLIRSAQGQIARHFVATTIKIQTPGISAFANDLAVTISPSSCTVPCSQPKKYAADDTSGDRVLASATAYVLIDRYNASLTIEPQPGMIAEVSGEQFRVTKVDYLHGSLRVFLAGGAAEGVAGA